MSSIVFLLLFVFCFEIKYKSIRRASVVQVSNSFAPSSSVVSLSSLYTFASSRASLKGPTTTVVRAEPPSFGLLVLHLYYLSKFGSDDFIGFKNCYNRDDVTSQNCHGLRLPSG